MQRPAAAVAEQHELARIEAVLDRDLLDGTGHDHGRERDDAVGHLYEALGPRIAERAGDVAHGLARRLGVELQFATEEAVRIETPEHQIGVGDCRLCTAAAVASAARARAELRRPDM